MHLKLDRIRPGSGDCVDIGMQDAKAAIVRLRNLGNGENPVLDDG
jgi:hypothetical protein